MKKQQQCCARHHPHDTPKKKKTPKLKFWKFTDFDKQIIEIGVIDPSESNYSRLLRRHFENFCRKHKNIQKTSGSDCHSTNTNILEQTWNIPTEAKRPHFCSQKCHHFGTRLQDFPWLVLGYSLEMLESVLLHSRNCLANKWFEDWRNLLNLVGWYRAIIWNRSVSGMEQLLNSLRWVDMYNVFISHVKLYLDI